ncbi:MAG: hypothetical protein J5715_00285 [Clostridiales bacterium]|nr:hypothetical protein [Clostridiales bacterium]MBO4578569.1 hypothetical protein [Clostridiales bacterium]
MNCPELFKDKKLTVIVGAYGSGKSEISVNAAFALRQAFPSPAKILLADMDIVNPFYRSADAGSILEEAGVKVVAPAYARSNVDSPILTGEMYIVFDDPEYRGVFDIGGEDMGAVVLGSLKSRMETIPYQVLMAVNTLRPFTSDPQQIAEMTVELSRASGLPIAGYINNTNLLHETSPEMIEEGEAKIIEAGKLTGVPLVLTTLLGHLEGLKSQCEIFEMDKRIFYDY